MRMLASIVLGFEFAAAGAGHSGDDLGRRRSTRHVAIPLCLGLAVLAILVAAGLLRNRTRLHPRLGVQVGAVGLGFVVPVMFVLGVGLRRPSGWRRSCSAAGSTRPRPPRPSAARPTRLCRPDYLKHGERTDMSQRTLVLLKPDTVRRGLVGEVLGRFEAKGLSDRRDGPAHDRRRAWPTSTTPSTSSGTSTRRCATSSPAARWSRWCSRATKRSRSSARLNGATDGRKAAPGTIRGDLSLSNRENLVHGSDSPESADREIKIWFPDLP